MRQHSDELEASAAGRAHAAGTLARVITELIRLAGGVLAVNELLLRTELRPQALLLIALMIAGAQGFESIVDRLLQR